VAVGIANATGFAREIVGLFKRSEGAIAIPKIKLPAAEFGASLSGQFRVGVSLDCF
jgi:hypothetical protein